MRQASANSTEFAWLQNSSYQLKFWPPTPSWPMGGGPVDHQRDGECHNSLQIFWNGSQRSHNSSQGNALIHVPHFFSTLLIWKWRQFWNHNAMWQSMCLTINNPTNDDPPHLIEQEMGRGDGGGGVLDVIEWQLVAIIQNKNITYNLICSGSPGGNWCISVIVSVNQAGAGAD